MDILSSPVVKRIWYESLIYDNELEAEHVANAQQPKKELSTPTGGRIEIPPVSVSEIKFVHSFPELRNAVVTLLTTEEYEKIAESLDHD